MKGLGLLLALVLAAGTNARSNPAGNEASAPACPAPTTLDELTKALDDAVSGPGNKDRTCLRDLLTPDARLSPLVKLPDGKVAARSLTVDDWIAAVGKRGDEAFYERQIKVTKEQYGHIAHLWSEYEIRPTPDGKATTHGVNSIQAVYDGSHWKVLAVFWESEATAESAPAREQ